MSTLFERVRRELYAAQDEDYRRFHQSLCPNADLMIGVRMPIIRKITRKIARSEDFRSYFSVEPYYYEEYMITGILIAAAPLNCDEKFSLLASFIPKMDNWAVCDAVASSFKLNHKTNPTISDMWQFFTSYQNSQETFSLRFMFVMFLDHFLLPEYLSQIFTILNQTNSEEYYVMMAEAWLIAEAFIKYRETTLDFLKQNHLSKFVQNKAIQKIRESYRVSDQDKSMLLTLKRH